MSNSQVNATTETPVNSSSHSRISCSFNGTSYDFEKITGSLKEKGIPFYFRDDNGYGSLNITLDNPTEEQAKILNSIKNDFGIGVDFKDTFRSFDRFSKKIDSFIKEFERLVDYEPMMIPSLRYRYGYPSLFFGYPSLMYHPLINRHEGNNSDKTNNTPDWNECLKRHQAGEKLDNDIITRLLQEKVKEKTNN